MDKLKNFAASFYHQVRGFFIDLYAVFLITKSPYFNKQWYISQAVNEMGKRKNAAFHYYKKGWAYYSPSENFDSKQYLLDYPDVEMSKVCPLYHYEKFGKKEGRHCHSKTMNSGKYRKLRIYRSILRKIGRFRYRKLIVKNQRARFLVCFQLYYPNSWYEVKEYLKNLSCYTYHLMVSYQDHVNMKHILDDIIKFKHDAQIICVENIGFDIGGFISVLNRVDLSAFDIVYKIHSKGTGRNKLYMYQQLFKKRDWFIYLYEGIIGAQTVHLTINELLHNSKCGLVAAKNLIVRDPPYKSQLVNRMFIQIPGCSMPCDIMYHFVAGTCFALRAEQLNWLKKADLIFTKSKRGDFSLAHAVERIICFMPQINGLNLVGNPVCLLRRKMRKVQAKQYQNNAFDTLVSDERFDLDADFVYKILEWQRDKLSEYLFTKTSISEIKRRWFHDFIPLHDLAPYRYLDGDTNTYDEYCAYHIKHNLSSMTRERYDTLIASFKQNGFDQRKAIVITQDNVILDGQHRLCILLKQFGDQYQVPTVILHLKKPIIWR